MSAVTPGMLDTRVELARPSAALDDLGAPQGFEPVGFAWAKLDPAGISSAGEPYLGQGRARVRLTMRVPIALAPGWRVTLGAQSFTVLSLLARPPRGGLVEIECVEDAP